MKRQNIISVSICSILLFALAACTDVWEEHYQSLPELNVDKTLWDCIKSDPELSEFANFLEETGYDTLLSKNRCYTVWAPINGSEFFETNSTQGVTKKMRDEYRKEFVENHIADYSHVAGGKLSEDNLVRMLNGKYIRFENASGDYTFKGISLKAGSNVSTKNGVLHKINGYATFTANIWEQLGKENQQLDSLYAFLYKDYKREPDWGASLKGPMVDGQIVYLDTTWRVTCPWFSALGDLHREDSSYTMFALTNKAWKEMYDMAEKYFTYAVEYKKEGDSVRQAVVKEFMCRNLVFSDKVNKEYANGDPKIPYDTLVSNYNLRYTDPLVFGGDEVKGLYRGAKTLALSNGTLNIVDEVNFDPLKCWHDTIRVEGEGLKGNYGVGSTLNEYDNADAMSQESINKDSVLWYKSISKGKVGVFKNKNDENPKLSIRLNDVLSASYKVKVVVVPCQIIRPDDTLYVKPNKFYATLTCGSPEFKGSTFDIVLGRKDSCIKYQRMIYSDPTKIDTIELVPLELVGEDVYEPTGESWVNVPVCEYKEEEKLKGNYQTRLSITSCLDKYDLSHMKDYKSAQDDYDEARKELLNAEENLAMAEEAYLKAMEDPTIAEKDLKDLKRKYDKALDNLEDAKEDLEEAKKFIEEMESEPLKFFDNVLRIDQVLLEPITITPKK